MTPTHREVTIAAELAQQCHRAKPSQRLPDGWTCSHQSTAHWGTTYSLFGSEKDKAVVCAVSGAENLLQLLTDPTAVRRLNNVTLETSHSTSNAAETNPMHGGEIDNVVAKLNHHLGEPLQALVMAQLISVAVESGLISVHDAAVHPSIASLAVGFVYYTTTDPPDSLARATLETAKIYATQKMKTAVDEEENCAVLTDMRKMAATHWPGHTLSLVGYSLGAPVAELFSVVLGVQCITFESPGLPLDILNTAMKRHMRQGNEFSPHMYFFIIFLLRYFEIEWVTILVQNIDHMEYGRCHEIYSIDVRGIEPNYMHPLLYQTMTFETFEIVTSRKQANQNSA